MIVPIKIKHPVQWQDRNRAKRLTNWIIWGNQEGRLIIKNTPRASTSKSVKPKPI